ncbi:cation:proton antiporter [Rhodobacteraceae bacterium NNCM2]|nr:cation:proton antiporter [Coraliihabitans acroporae]
MSIVAFGLLVVVVLLIIAALSVPLARRLGLPVTVLFASAGLLYGLSTILLHVGTHGGVLDNYNAYFVGKLSLGSQALIYLFLPPLLFEMSVAVNVRRLLDEIGIVLVMAIFAVVTATLVIGGLIWLASPIGFVACLLLGAAVATTDPGAVISTFREIGAPRRLLVILEGESLLNDAAAIVIFALMLGVLQSRIDPSIGGMVMEFGYSFGVGALTGLAVALVGGRFYPILERSSVAEASVTVAVAYGAFLLAEEVFGASGVVAVVFSGLATGSAAFLNMGPGNWVTVRTVWGQIGFWANALITILAASLVPGLIAQESWTLVPLVFVVYIGAIIARATIIFGVLPLMAHYRLSSPIRPAQGVLIIWGGVRGALTLVLAIAIADLAVLGEDARFLGALAACYTLVTIFVNASTLAWLTSRLGLDKLSKADLALRDQIVSGSLERVRSVVRNLARARELEPEALEEVESAIGKRLDMGGGKLADQHIPFGELLRIGLAIMGGQESRLVRRAFEEGAIGPRATQALRLDADRITDASRQAGREGYETAAIIAMRPSLRYRLAVILQQRLRIDGPLRRSIEIQLTKLLESERIVRELQHFGENTVTPMIGEEAARNLIALLNWRHEAINSEINAFAAQYPQYALDLEKTLVGRAVIRRERQQYLKLLNDGVIGQELYHSLSADLDKRERVVAKPPRLDLTLTPMALIHRVPLFADLTDKQRRAVAKRLKPIFASPGDVILAKGTRGSEMFFIASGAVELDTGDEVTPLGTGDYFGAISLIEPLRRRTSDVTSLGYSRLLVLRRRDFLKLAEKDKSLDDLIRRTAERQMQVVIERSRAQKRRAREAALTVEDQSETPAAVKPE